MASPCIGTEARAPADLTIAYLRDRGDKLLVPMPLVLSYLERRYPRACDWKWLEPRVRRLLTRMDTPGQEGLALFRRLVEGGASAPPVPPSEIADNEIDKLTAPAVWCDRFPLPVTYVDGLREAIARGGYDLTHAALALQWATENRCLAADDVADLRRRIVPALRDLVGRPGLSDVQVEAAAMLDYLGEPIPTRFVGRLRASVRTIDGRGDPIWRDPAADHTATLALWVLLAADGRGVRVDWVRR